ncbi:hypothetical protein JCM4814A_02290 [Streptomyces phaeofaciens JCM 4814]|uniref:Uncharacterized protein n=1 Tax=Streptomyces phaeofaciens TaxID=68254 RepID=A0A918M0F7_9ACTN|nr:SRPBCC family protein [Streptomyces phaeofaciens]GGT93262.1 hypothetical protein GCM10010226_83940 [Streptomyces phaeofaciens]
MATLVKNQQYNASAAQVWDLVGDFYTVDTWIPGIASTVRDDVRKTRTITTHDGARLVERLLDEGPHFHHYHIDDSGTLPLRNVTARLAVTETGPQQSAIDWTVSFDPAIGSTEADAAAFISGFYQACLDRVAVELGV